MANPKLTEKEIDQLLLLRAKHRERIKKQSDSKKRLYDIITLNVPKGVKEIWKSEADSEYKSLTKFIIDAVDFYIDNK